MSGAALWLALRAPVFVTTGVTRWSLRWYAIAAALLVPVILLCIADARLRAAR